MADAGSTSQDWRARPTSAVDAVSSIRPGDRVFVGTACATPRALVDALEQLGKPPAGVVLTHFLTDRVGSGETRAAYPVAEERDTRLRDGRAVRIRPTRTGDFRALQDLFYRMPEEDVRTRFFQELTALTDVAAQNLCSVDYERDMAFAAVVGPPEHERVVATSCYFGDARGLAEVGYMVDPEWQGVGLAGILHERMVEYARAREVRGFTAEVLTSNPAMLRVFSKGDHETLVTTSEGVHDVRMLFASGMAG
jgi:RimJ/RimL family protein N-acetyltransferase